MKKKKLKKIFNINNKAKFRIVIIIFRGFLMVWAIDYSINCYKYYISFCLVLLGALLSMEES